MTFTQWLTTQIDADDPIGDLARDARDDKAWPRDGSLEVYRAHLAAMGACREAVAALELAYRRYEDDDLPFSNLPLPDNGLVN